MSKLTAAQRDTWLSEFERFESEGRVLTSGRYFHSDTDCACAVGILAISLGYDMQYSCETSNDSLQRAENMYPYGLIEANDAGDFERVKQMIRDVEVVG